MNIYLYEIKKKMVSTLIWVSSLAVFSILFYTMFEAMASEVMADLLADFDQTFLKAFGMEGDLSTIISYTAMISVYIVLCAAIFSCNLGLNAVHIEERDMTADFLIPKPVTRNKILTVKILAAATHMLLFSIANSLACYAGMEIFKGNQEYSFLTFALLMLAIFIVQLLFFVIGLFISVALKKMESPLPFSMGLAFGLFILNSFDTILEDTFFRFIIPYDYFEFHYIVEHSSYKTYGMIISLVLIVSLTLGSYLLYNRRNIATAM